MKHAHAYRPVTGSETELELGGTYQYRVGGEPHLFNPETIAKLQHAVRASRRHETFEGIPSANRSAKAATCTPYAG